MHILIQGISVVVCLLVISDSHLFCQTDTIGGVINRYTNLLYIECTNNSAIVVQNPYGFKAGDKILIIQMKGADVNVSNSSSCGGITSYNNAGNYELATIDEVNGKSFVLTHQLSREYTLAGIVQVVRVPSYNNVVVKDLLQAQPWNGSTGGVLALISSGTVTLNENINVRGQGFRVMVSRWPGIHLDSIQPFGIYLAGGSLHYYSHLRRWDSGSVKGEGIHEGQFYYMAARGKLANAGGGGHSANSGGGGGGNASAGGTGGNDIDNVANGGIGGVGLPYANTNNRLFMGGSGGGAGPWTESRGYGGENGGGIIIIQANQIVGNGHEINAGGNYSIAPSEYFANGDGGGAGGVVVLDVNQYSGNLAVKADGGNGRTITYCTGPGGGGGGGCVWVKGSSLPPSNVVITVNGGDAGTSICNPNPQHGAQAGSAGVKLTGLQIPVSTIPR